MIHKTVALTRDARLHVYGSDICVKNAPRDGILVIPGGGYSSLAVDREGEPIALTFMGMGYQCFVLEYSVKEKAKFPTPLTEAALAMRYIRENAESCNVDPERIFAMGFSAGGHLTAALGSFWHRQDLTGVPPELARPRGTVLVYPVITTGEFTHLGSTQRLCGTQTPSQQERDAWSMEKQVTEHTVPAFLVHTATDKAAPVENTLLFASALSRKQIPMEVHIFPRGAHGLALANRITARNENEFFPEFAQWPSLAHSWMRSL